MLHGYQLSHHFMSVRCIAEYYAQYANFGQPFESLVAVTWPGCGAWLTRAPFAVLDALDRRFGRDAYEGEKRRGAVSSPICLAHGQLAQTVVARGADFL